MPRPDRHRAALILAAADMLQLHGYSGTGLDEVLREADATNGSLYHHFPDGKAQLAQAALEASGKRVEAALRKAFREAPDATTALTRWVTGLVRTLEGDPRRGCPIAPTALEAANVSEEVRAAADEAFVSWRGVMAEEFAREMPTDRAAETAAVVLAAIEGSLLLDRTGQRTDALKALRSAIPRLLGRG